MLDRLRCFLFGHKPGPSIFRFVKLEMGGKPGDLVYTDATSRDYGKPFRICQRCQRRV